MKVLEQLMKEYGNDPLYMAVLNAKSAADSTKAIEILQAIRGNTAYKTFKNRCKYLTLLKG